MPEKHLRTIGVRLTKAMDRALEDIFGRDTD